VPEIGTLGLMSGDGKRSVGLWPQATAPILDSTRVPLTERPRLGPPLGVEREQQPFAAAEKLRAAHLFADKQKAPPRVP